MIIENFRAFLKTFFLNPLEMFSINQKPIFHSEKTHATAR